MAQDFGKITQDVVAIFGKNLINDLIGKLRSKNKNASGKLIESLNVKLQAFAEQYVLEFSGEEYLQNIEQGRKSGSYPPIGAIRKWASIKGLLNKKGAEYAIQKSIYKLGIKPLPTLNEVIESNSLSKYSSRMESDYVSALEQYSKEIIQKELKK